MQPLSSINTNLGVAILLTGPAGGGKTVLGMRMFPKTYCFFSDFNFDSGKRYLEKIGESSKIVGADFGPVDETGKAVAPLKRYERMLDCLTKVEKDPNVDAIFIDSATFIEDYIKAKICGAMKDEMIKLSNFDQWGNYLITWKSLILQLRQTGKKLIMASHEKKERDESDGIYKYQIALDGQIRDKFPALFSDVWRCEVVEANGKHAYMVRTLGNVRHELKNTYGLPAMLLADEVVKLVGGGK